VIEVRDLGASDRAWYVALLEERWGGDVQIMDGRAFRPAELPTLLARDGGRWVGVASYELADGVAWLMLIEVLEPRRGIGTALVDRFLDIARTAGCGRAKVVTTNDNVAAQAFYTARGFRLVAVRAGAVARARLQKPSIPLVALDGTPIADELEYERDL
jgi:GNAT superfamily N-acetyltransferase